jgi:hypothetical protein
VAPTTHSGEGLAETAVWLMASSGAAEASQIQVAIKTPHGLAVESCALGQGARRGLRLSIAARCTIHGPTTTPHGRLMLTAAALKPEQARQP